MIGADAKKKLAAASSVLYPIGAAAFTVALWAVTAAAAGNELLVPSVGETFAGLWEMLGESATYAAIGGTVLRSLEGFALAFAAALLFAAPAVVWAPCRKLFAPFMAIMRSVPTMSVIMLSLLWATGAVTPLIVVFMTVFPVIYSSFIAAADGVDRKAVQMAAIYRVPLGTRVIRLYLPGVLPQIFESARSTLSLTLKITIAAEVLAQTRDSIGVGMQQAQSMLQTDRLLAWTLIAVVLGAMAELAVTAVAAAVRRLRYARRKRA